MREMAAVATVSVQAQLTYIRIHRWLNLKNPKQEFEVTEASINCPAHLAFSQLAFEAFVTSSRRPSSDSDIRGRSQSSKSHERLWGRSPCSSVGRDR